MHCVIHKHMWASTSLGSHLVVPELVCVCVLFQEVEHDGATCLRSHCTRYVRNPGGEDARWCVGDGKGVRCGELLERSAELSEGEGS